MRSSKRAPTCASGSASGIGAIVAASDRACAGSMRLPAQWTGVIFGNEVLDALPVEIAGRDGSLACAAASASRATASAGAMRTCRRPLRAAIDALFPTEHYESESTRGRSADRNAAGILRRGLLLWIDYGFPASEYYHPQRDTGR
jgi:SAM-dependent MidA family methyltransferase